jgi:hypothetical protein
MYHFAVFLTQQPWWLCWLYLFVYVVGCYYAGYGVGCLLGWLFRKLGL